MSIRLIDTSTFQMRVFVGEKIPNYAILSHTWVDDEEVDFQEMTAIACDPRHPATLKPGYTKIRFTCEEARRHNIKYVWVDTCTIDKSSSTELSEAINSMFKWYRNAEVCYVFLSDLEPGVDVEEAMKSCRWYKRGWTLQELIAPENLRFYNRIWEFVGTKSDLKSTVSAITGVDQVVLMDCTVLPEFPLARRMSWASQRTTTRTEDLAYCLLGIFDVNMPLLYGEGNKAFIRLQEEIIKHSNDLSIFWNFPCTTTGSIEGLGFYPGRDLFATTPRDFSESGDIVPRTLAVGFKREFALTNNGVRFATAKFKVLLLRGYYVMDLQHTYGRSQDCLMALQKIGPGVFVRLAISLEKCWRGSPALVDSLNPCENEDAYVVSKISASIEEQMHTCRRHALRFEIHEEGRERYRRIIEVPTPHENWNSAHQEFITMGQPSVGYVSLRDLSGFSRQKNERYCYLVCSFQHCRSIVFNLNESVLQMKLLAPHDLEKHHARLDRGVEMERLLLGHPDRYGNKEDRLVLDGVTVSAKFEVADDCDYPSYRITIRFEHHHDSKKRYWFRMALILCFLTFTLPLWSKSIYIYTSTQLQQSGAQRYLTWRCLICFWKTWLSLSIIQ
jgi:hypothetical protein